MGLIKNEMDNKIYAYVLSDGFIRTKSEERVGGAIRRDYETPSGEKGTKFELVFAKLEGFIKRIGFKETEFGKFLETDIQDIKDEKVVCLSLNVENSFAQDLMKKIPNINFNEKVLLVPYSMDIEETGRSRKGITVYQNNKKLANFFFDAINKKSLNGFPDVDREKSKTFDKDDWKIYFLSVKKFLVKYIEDNIIPKIKTEEPKKEIPEPDEEITIEDINEAISGSVEVETPQPILEKTVNPAPVSSISKFSGVPFHTKEEKEEMLMVIAEMAKAKFGSETPEKIKEDVMNATGLAFVDFNLVKITEALDKIPNRK